MSDDTNPVGRPPIYQYERYADGDVYEMVRGRDTAATVTSIRVALHQGAKRRGFYLQTSILDEDTIRFRFLPEKPKELAAVPKSKVKKGIVKR
jgi:hypothetical protein